MIYFGSYDDHVYALDAGTGEEKWRYGTDSWVYSSPAVTDGIVYVGSNDGYMYAFDAETGDVKWKYKTEGEWASPTHEQPSKEKTTSETSETPAFEAILAIACILALIGIKRMRR